MSLNTVKRMAVTDVTWKIVMFDHFRGLFFLCLSLSSVLGCGYEVALSLPGSITVTEKSFLMLLFSDMVYI